jgi:hypothetical protein
MIAYSYLNLFLSVQDVVNNFNSVGEIINNSPDVTSGCKLALVSACANFAEDKINYECTVKGPPCHIMFPKVALPSSTFIASSIDVINAGLEAAACISLGGISELPNCDNGGTGFDNDGQCNSPAPSGQPASSIYPSYQPIA